MTDQRSATALEYRAWYATPQWQSMRTTHRQTHPLCAMCMQAGRINDGSRRIDGSLQPNHRKRTLVVDHVRPHKGNRALFFDPMNLQSLCSDHHDRVKQQIEARGYETSVRADGWPADPNHRAYRKP